MNKLFSSIIFLAFIACNNAPESNEQKVDTSASSSADSILKAVEKMKADSAAMQKDTTGMPKDSLRK